MKNQLKQLFKDSGLFYPLWDFLVALGIKPSDTQGIDKARLLLEELIQQSPPNNSQAPEVIFTSLESKHIINSIHTLLEIALRQRGANVSHLECNSSLPDCTWFRPPPSISQLPCSECTRYQQKWKHSKFNSIKLKNLITSSMTQAAKDFSHEAIDVPIEQLSFKDIDLGPWLEVIFPWRTLTPKFEQLPGHKQDKKSLLNSFALQILAAEKLYTLKPEATLFALNGYLLTTAPWLAVWQKHGGRYITWEHATTKNRLAATKNGLVLRRRPDPQTWEQLTKKESHQKVKSSVEGYLSSRISGKGEHNTFNTAQLQGAKQLKQSLKLDDRPLIGIFTNCTWDSAALGVNNLFSSMQHWLESCCDRLAQKKEFQVVIRVHPSDSKPLKSNDPVLAYLQNRYPKTPEHFRFIGPDDTINSYDLFPLLSAAATYTSTISLELASAGIPVYLAGAAPFANLGITKEYSSIQDYLDNLTSESHTPLPNQEDHAHAFLYWNAFESTYEIPGLEFDLKKPEKLEFKLESEQFDGLDHLCRFILS